MLYRSQIDKNLQGKELPEALKKGIERSTGKHANDSEIKKIISRTFAGKSDYRIEQELKKMKIDFFQRKKASNLINPKEVSLKSDDPIIRRRVMANIKYAQRQRMMEDEKNSLNLSAGKLQTKQQSTSRFAGDYKPSKNNTPSSSLGSRPGASPSSRPNLPF